MDEQPTNDLQEFVDVDRVIHEPARLVIIAILYAVEQADFLYLLREAGLSKGNLSTHLTKLENAGYVAIEKTYNGKVPRTICHLTDKGRNAFHEYREHLKMLIERTAE